MLRYSEGYIIVIKDLEEGFVKKHNYKNLLEYWIYEAKHSNIFLPNGSLAKSITKEAKLTAIIVCENNKITKKANNFLVAGYKFTENDLYDYLKKTERGING